MAGTIIADFIRTDANRLSLQVGNTTFATINAMGLLSNTGTTIIAANGVISGAGTIAKTALPSGSILQVVNADLASFFSTSATIPLDDTIPQITEGAEILTCAITPTSATSKLIIDVVMNVANDNASNISYICLFQDSTANALRAAWSRTVAANNPVSPMVLKHYMTAGTTSSTTFRVRGGSSSASTFQINGGSGTRYQGGSLISSITITEIAA